MTPTIPKSWQHDLPPFSERLSVTDDLHIFSCYKEIGGESCFYVFQGMTLGINNWWLQGLMARPGEQAVVMRTSSSALEVTGFGNKLYKLDTEFRPGPWRKFKDSHTPVHSGRGEEARRQR